MDFEESEKEGDSSVDVQPSSAATCAKRKQDLRTGSIKSKRRFSSINKRTIRRERANESRARKHVQSDGLRFDKQKQEKSKKSSRGRNIKSCSNALADVMDLSASSSNDAKQICRKFAGSSDDDDPLWARQNALFETSADDDDVLSSNKRTQRNRQRRRIQGSDDTDDKADDSGSKPCSPVNDADGLSERVVVQAHDSAIHCQNYMHLLQSAAPSTMLKLDEFMRNFSDARFAPMSKRKSTCKLWKNCYQYVRFECTHASSYRKRNSSDQKRNVRHGRMQCQATYNWSFDKNRSCYTLGKCVLMHNHCIGRLN